MSEANSPTPAPQPATATPTIGLRPTAPSATAGAASSVIPVSPTAMMQSREKKPVNTIGRTIFFSLAILGAGASAYYAYTFKQKFEKTIALRQGAPNELVSAEDFKNARTQSPGGKYKQPVLEEGFEPQNKKTYARAEKQQQDREIKVRERDDATALRNEERATLDRANAKNTELKTTLASVQSDLDRDSGEINTINGKLEEAGKQLADQGVSFDKEDVAGSVQKLRETITSLENSNKDKDGKNNELATVLDGAQKKVAGENQEISKRQDKQSEWRRIVRQNGSEAVVTSVDHKWGFVVLNAGTNDNINLEAPLMVIRNNKRIAILRNPSIETRQTVCEIVPGSMREGLTVEPGDTVIMRNPQG